MCWLNSWSLSQKNSCFILSPIIIFEFWKIQTSLIFFFLWNGAMLCVCWNFSTWGGQGRQVKQQQANRKSTTESFLVPYISEETCFQSTWDHCGFLMTTPNEKVGCNGHCSVDVWGPVGLPSTHGTSQNINSIAHCILLVGQGFQIFKD